MRELPGMPDEVCTARGSVKAETGADVWRQLQASVARFSLFWLAAANLVGVLLAFLLVRPRSGVMLGEWSYGRWVALHLNWQLYGWCSLPMVGALLKRYLRPAAKALDQARGALWAWSLALGLGGLSWLEGETSGKLFLDWMGLARVLFVLAMVFLWGLLAWNFFQRRRMGAPGWMADAMMLVALAAVPWSIYWSSGREIYPAIDPGTGGPTGASLLASTLGVVLIAALVPWLLRVPGKPGVPWKPFWVCFGIEGAVCVAISHGNSSHFDWRQYGALASLIVWIPMLGLYWRRFAWSHESRRWLSATLAWWALLVLSGVGAFLPGVLDRIKFTHILVAHSHLAMAGFLTNMNMLVLSNISDPESAAVKSLNHPVPYFAWQGALAFHIACLVGIGMIETADPERWYTGSVTPLLWARLGAGALMAAVSLHWLAGAVRAHEIGDRVGR